MGKETAEKLSDKELHCISRMLQSAWRAPGQENIPTEGCFMGAGIVNIHMNVKC